VLACTEPTQAQWPKHFKYRFEVYDHGTFVESRIWETDAQNQDHLQQLQWNAERAYAQDLDNRRVRYDRITPVLLDVQPH
jgi:hypothetical protein